MSTTGRIYAGTALCLTVLVTMLVLVGRFNADPDAGRAVDVVAMEPADGAVLPDLPSTVRIRVDGRPDPRRSHITVYDAERARLDTGSVASDGDDGLRQQVVVSRPGQLAVAYHVVTVDGRAASGIAHLTVGVPDAAPPAAGTGGAQRDTHAHGVDPVGAALLALDGLVLLVVLVLLLRRPTRGPA